MVIAEENRPSEKFHEGHLLVDSMIEKLKRIHENVAERERRQHDCHHFCKLVFRRSSLAPVLKILNVQLFQCELRGTLLLGGIALKGPISAESTKLFLRVYCIVNNSARDQSVRVLRNLEFVHFL